MEDLYKNYLFSKGFLVSDSKESHEPEDIFNSLIGLGNLFGIIITKQANLADVNMIHTAEECLGGTHVSEPFYRGFPGSVLQLTRDQLIIDQLYSYFITYGMNDFEGEGTRSIFEDQIKRDVLKEKTDPKYFEILTEQQALEKLASYVDDLLLSTRPLNATQYNLVKTWVNRNMDLNAKPDKVASKNTAIKLLVDTRLWLFAEKFLTLPDTIKVVEELLNTRYPDQKINKLNLTNKDRKFVKCLIFVLTRKATENQMRECLEKRKIWKGLLHHIHLNPRNPRAPRNKAEETFVKMIFDDSQRSCLSSIEYYISTGKIRQACDVLKTAKGATAVLRNMNYLLSRCKTDEDKDYVIENAFESNSPIVLIQQLYNYYNYDTGNKDCRTFKFTKNNLFVVHKETVEENLRRKSYITVKDKEKIALKIENRLQDVLKNRLGKVYIDPDMVNIAVPIQETTGNLGYGVLTRGSRIPLDSRIIRLFTYWEKVNDIDLSVMGIDSKGNLIEFSWRTFYNNQNDAICFSGDQTRGYEGGSEYIDVNLDKFKERYPNVKYLVVCDNVYSGTPFNSCMCTAGYMLREKVGSGEVFEPKTVKSSFLVQGDTTFSYLFAIDIDANDFVWLNVNKDSNTTVAGTTDFDFLISYIESVNVFNLYKLFTYLATEVVDNIEDADVIVTDKALKGFGDCQTIIRSNDVEKIMKLIN